ncbi:uncharacterized protein LOC123196320 isoform X2 [Mangifera indica]|uniref:uncharacterized protein LOC123196320 isoform X2 n=1 Tax=Mangifera indica TaxID=29780 RepID=UPI001CFBF242|nr:uncharacterized protein LOC123196320 isoform X2 [Mangifera indica]XP_044466234.1 uncharacterized protein LOC123196320 isoform X2 [Mangifera indica]
MKMQDSQIILKISVIWRGNKYVVEMNSDACLKELGNELHKLTDVKADTMKLIVPQNKGSKLMSPFSDDHSRLSLREVCVIEGKPIRMMGVSEDEVNKILQNEKADLRIVGFDEEEKRLRQRMFHGPLPPLKLPQGQYIFCDFRTLQIPGVELNPSASEALKRMHMLAADPGIVAIMNKHHWRVGIMKELAPVGYVGISPKCILGFNKNHGEEISLRLRTDNLKGFRKYESIKKTLLHELAHMVYSEHDANFYALDKQLNQEAASLDWTKSRGHTLRGVRYSDQYEENLFAEDVRNASHKLGGNVSEQLASARASSVAAAYRRLVNVSANSFGASEECEESDHMDLVEKENKIEPDPDDSLEGVTLAATNSFEEPDPDESDHMDLVEKENKIEPDPDDSLDGVTLAATNSFEEPDPDESDHMDLVEKENKIEPDPDDSLDGVTVAAINSFEEPDPDESDHMDLVEKENKIEPDPDDSLDGVTLAATNSFEEPDPDDSEALFNSGVVAEPYSHHSQVMEVESILQPRKRLGEPDPDDSEAKGRISGYTNIAHSLVNETRENQGNIKAYREPDPDESQANGIVQDEPDPDDSEAKGRISGYTNIVHSLVNETKEDQHNIKAHREPDPDESQASGIVQGEPDPDDTLVHPHGISSMKIDEPGPDAQELTRIQEPVTVLCNRLQKAIEMLQAEVNPLEASTVLQTLFRIIRNVIEHPEEMKYKRLRKANPIIQRNVAHYRAALEILNLIGFNEDVVSDEIGKAETYLVLKRNDPGLLWLAKSSLETCIA